MAVEHAVQASVTVDGQELARRLRPYVEKVVVDDHLHLPDAFTITLLDPDRDILEQAGLRIGARVEISGTALGEQEEASLIHAEVTALEADYDAFGARIVVRGYDLSHRLHRGRRTRTFVNVSDSDIARRIAEDAGIEVGEIEPTTETIPDSAEPGGPNAQRVYVTCRFASPGEAPSIGQLRVVLAFPDA